MSTSKKTSQLDSKLIYIISKGSRLISIKILGSLSDSLLEKRAHTPGVAIAMGCCLVGHPGCGHQRHLEKGLQNQSQNPTRHSTNDAQTPTVLYIAEWGSPHLPAGTQRTGSFVSVRGERLMIWRVGCFQCAIVVQKIPKNWSPDEGGHILHGHSSGP